MIPPIAVHCGIGSVLTAISVPLALRMVPMNRVYGVRVPKAFKSDRNWYDINAYGGKLLAVYGLSLIAFGIVGRGWAPSPTSIWMAVFVCGPLILVFPILALISSYARQLPD
ncbi:MAG: SdpI family protein [Desulfomonilaceae bacterium]